jgi:hypothetical protein
MIGFGEEKLIDSKEISQILDENISPFLQTKDLFWNGKDMWYSGSKNSIRHILKYQKTKGERGTFVWGVRLDFVPTFVSNKLKFYRTEKNLQLHLFERTDEVANAFFGGKLDGGVTTHWGKKAFEMSLKLLFDKYSHKIDTWFLKTTTLKGLVEVAKYQLEVGKGYQFHSPNQRLVLAFLLAKKEELDEAIECLSELDIEDEQKSLLIKQLYKTF